MEKTTVYLPAELKKAVSRAARARGISQAEVIRQSVERAVGQDRPRPRGALFSGGQSIAHHVDGLLDGFGER